MGLITYCLSCHRRIRIHLCHYGHLDHPIFQAMLVLCLQLQASLQQETQRDNAENEMSTNAFYRFGKKRENKLEHERDRHRPFRQPAREIIELPRNHAGRKCPGAPDPSALDAPRSRLGTERNI